VRRSEATPGYQYFAPLVLGVAVPAT